MKRFFLNILSLCLIGAGAGVVVLYVWPALQERGTIEEARTAIRKSPILRNVRANVRKLFTKAGGPVASKHRKPDYEPPPTLPSTPANLSRYRTNVIDRRAGERDTPTDNKKQKGER